MTEDTKPQPSLDPLITIRVEIEHQFDYGETSVSTDMFRVLPDHAASQLRWYRRGLEKSGCPGWKFAQWDDKTEAPVAIQPPWIEKLNL